MRCRIMGTPVSPRRTHRRRPISWHTNHQAPCPHPTRSLVSEALVVMDRPRWQDRAGRLFPNLEEVCVVNSTLLQTTSGAQGSHRRPNHDLSLFLRNLKDERSTEVSRRRFRNPRRTLNCNKIGRPMTAAWKRSSKRKGSSPPPLVQMMFMTRTTNP